MGCSHATPSKKAASCKSSVMSQTEVNKQHVLNSTVTSATSLPVSPSNSIRSESTNPTLFSTTTSRRSTLVDTIKALKLSDKPLPYTPEWTRARPSTPHIKQSDLNSSFPKDLKIVEA
eukprot:TRINITY_DN2504_c0_g1_i3.p1 TRINITY_DN2504_c0_g1~~TRINITY_DN2504_c0_g1_i3.p1  ORF type:complete len:118 (+),score=20.62 TRINITY_DN2504_c0_g1_i3:59-412(+)